MCIARPVDLVQATDHANIPVATGGFGGRSPPNKLHAPQIELCNTVNQWSFCQILECQAPCTNVKTLLKTFWRRFCMQVKWVTNFSSPFTVTNEARQGRVLSLFVVHLDELSDQLDSARVGCIVGNMVVNHLMFADDICVFSPSIGGL